MAGGWPSIRGVRGEVRLEELLSVLGQAIDEVVAPEAAGVDRTGTFPRLGVDRLAADGMLGLASDPGVGGAGLGVRQVAAVVEQLAGACASTAMIVAMHYAAVAVLEAHGPEGVRRAVARGDHLSTLALSEVGSRPHFWVPLSSATRDGGDVVLDAHKSWVTSASEADSYVWSSRPVAADGAMSLWFVPAATPGLALGAPFDGFGLRGNDSRPIRATGARVPAAALLGGDGDGLEVAMSVALPWFLVLSAAVSLGVTETAIAEVQRHLSSAWLEHLDVTLAETQGPRAELARMRLRLDQARALLGDCFQALEDGRADAHLRVLEVKVAAGEAAADVTDQALRVGGGAAFRKEVAVERAFRDARAARVMAPTSAALEDFIGRALTGQPLPGEPPTRADA